MKNKFSTIVKAVNDADIALASILKGEDGILTISGTGSISYGIYNNNVARSGGWGHILGDEDSGYYIAIEAFKRIVKERELGIKESELSRHILKKLNIWNNEEIKDFIYSSSKGDIAAVAPIVIEEANNDNKIAFQIVNNSAQALASITYNVYKKLCIKNNVKIGIKGSILVKSQLMNKLFKECAKTYIDDFIIIEDEVSSAKGAYYLAIKELNNKVI